MRIINFGSLNIDYVHKVQNFVKPGQTIFAQNYNIFAGGKGLNQSIAAARAGANVIHAGAVGPEGKFLLELLKDAGVDVSKTQVLSQASGHAMIEVDAAGQNRIIVYGGANRRMTTDYIDSMLDLGEKGDIVLLQNETNFIDYIITEAAKKGFWVAFNPSPIPEDPFSLPLSQVNCFIVNELEGAQLVSSQSTDHETILTQLKEHFPQASIVMTLGKKGVLYRDKKSGYKHGILKVPVIDTTAAGDTFCGYFLAGLCAGKSIPECLKSASYAAAITVSREGAALSIPTITEVRQKIAFSEAL